MAAAWTISSATGLVLPIATGLFLKSPVSLLLVGQALPPANRGEEEDRPAQRGQTDGGGFWHGTFSRQHRRIGV